MAIIDRIKWDGSPDILAWKFPSQDLSTWSQLIVNETQDAFLVSGGIYEGPFGPGQHQLTTENLPILRDLMGLVFGGQSPFSAEVWFVNKIISLDVKWGTPDPIQLKDPLYDLMIPVRAFGQYGVKVVDSKKFLLKLVGTLADFNSKTLAEYFKGIFLSKIKSLIANIIIKEKISVLEITTDLDKISNELQKLLSPEMFDFGLMLTKFTVISINVPEDDSAVIMLKGALAKKTEMGILGFNYHQERSFDVMQSAASNQGGGIIATGIGLGVGGALGVGMSQAMHSIVNNNLTTPQPQTQTVTSQNVNEGSLNQMNQVDKIKFLKELAELKNQGIITDAEFQSEKSKIFKL